MKWVSMVLTSHRLRLECKVTRLPSDAHDWIGRRSEAHEWQNCAGTSQWGSSHLVYSTAGYFHSAVPRSVTWLALTTWKETQQEPAFLPAQRKKICFEMQISVANRSHASYFWQCCHGWVPFPKLSAQWRCCWWDRVWLTFGECEHSRVKLIHTCSYRHSVENIKGFSTCIFHQFNDFVIYFFTYLSGQLTHSAHRFR